MYLSNDPSAAAGRKSLTTNKKLLLHIKSVNYVTYYRQCVSFSGDNA